MNNQSKKSTEDNVEAKKIQQDGFDILYQAKINRHVERRDNLRANTPKAYSLIMEKYCAKGMQNRIEEHPDFESKIKNNPIELLKAIQTLINNPIRGRYPFACQHDDLLRLAKARQYEDESLADYIKRFKQLRDVYKRGVGKHTFDGWVTTTEEYKQMEEDHDNAGKKELKDTTFEKWCTYALVMGADQKKHGSLIKGWTSQYSMVHNQWPQTMPKANDILMNHKFDKHPDNNRNNGNKERQEQQKQDSETDRVQNNLA